MPARDLFEALGTARLNRTTFRPACVRVLGGLVYDGIACPPGSFRRPRPAVAAACAARGLPCAAPAGAAAEQTCVCQPCRVADEVEIRAAALPLAAPPAAAMPQVPPPVRARARCPIARCPMGQAVSPPRQALVRVGHAPTAGARLSQSRSPRQALV